MTFESAAFWLPYWLGLARRDQEGQSMMRCVKGGGVATLVLAMGLTAAAASNAGSSAEDKIAARPITYADLGKLVRGFKGKVVVVDFWSVY
jgi:hypothetical protein